MTARRTLRRLLTAPQRRLTAFQARQVAAFERSLQPYKQRLFEGVGGTILEIGPGLGTNFPYMPAGARWIGLEPDQLMHDFLREEAARHDLHPAILDGRAEHIPLADASIDAAVGTLVLCSVDDPAAVLREILRVTRPGAPFVFVEHVAAPARSWRRPLQVAARPLWRLVAGGCRLDQETGDLIEQTGFTSVSLERVQLGRVLADPHVIGIARR